MEGEGRIQRHAMRAITLVTAGALSPLFPAAASADQPPPPQDVSYS